MKKALLVIALSAFVGTSAFALDHDKGKGKKKEKCAKENCCKKSAAKSTGATPSTAPTTAEPTKCTKGTKGACCSKGAVAPEKK